MVHDSNHDSACTSLKFGPVWVDVGPFSCGRLEKQFLANYNTITVHVTVQAESHSQYNPADGHFLIILY